MFYRPENGHGLPHKKVHESRGGRARPAGVFFDEMVESLDDMRAKKQPFASQLVAEVLGHRGRGRQETNIVSATAGRIPDVLQNLMSLS